jgi:hypothetical protein
VQYAKENIWYLKEIKILNVVVEDVPILIGHPKYQDHPVVIVGR